MANRLGVYFLDLQNYLFEQSGRTVRVKQVWTWWLCQKFVVFDGQEVLFESFSPTKTLTFIFGYVKGLNKNG